MNRSRPTVLIIAIVAALGVAVVGANPTLAQRTDETEQPTETDIRAAFGETGVHYYDGGELEYSTAIPGGSTFHTAGRGQGGGGAMACETFRWSQTLPGATDLLTGVQQPDTLLMIEQPSFAWTYREIVPTELWTPALQGVLDTEFGSGVGPDMVAVTTAGERYYAQNAPLATATRRFNRTCKTPVGFVNNGERRLYLDANGEYERGSVDVPMTDPFWNPLERLGILWGMIQLPTYRVIAPPEVNTYGGLVVNMPTWLQIEASAWRPYFTDIDQCMGWTSQLGLFPSELHFEVVGPGGGTIPCAPAESAARGGAIPGMPDDLPRYYELGQLDQDCTWVPQDRGDVTVRARITYDVLLTISGYSEWLSPYVWYSDPLTMSVGELRIRNVTPEGGIGG